MHVRAIVTRGPPTAAQRVGTPYRDHVLVSPEIGPMSRKPTRNTDHSSRRAAFIWNRHKGQGTHGDDATAQDFRATLSLDW